MLLPVIIQAHFHMFVHFVKLKDFLINMKMRILLKIWTKNGLSNCEWCQMEDDGSCMNVLAIHAKDTFKIKKFVRKQNATKWRIELDCVLLRFLSWFGKQNDYLFPPKNCKNPEIYPFKKPHLWKTRFGFKTSWTLSNY